jgi:hypothetical protein
MPAAVNLTPVDDAQLVANGYEPIPVTGKAPLVVGWRTGDIVTLRAAAGAGPSTGLRTGAIIGIDVDIINSVHVAELVTLIEREIGATLLHRVGSKGRMLVYRTRTPIPKLTVAGAGGQIEFLGQGQQFVAFGIHPDTGKPYRWVGGPDADAGLPCDPFTVSAADLPAVVTPEALHALAAKLRDALEKLGYAPGLNQRRTRP